MSIVLVFGANNLKISVGTAGVDLTAVRIKDVMLSSASPVDLVFPPTYVGLKGIERLEAALNAARKVVEAKMNSGRGEPAKRDA